MLFIIHERKKVPFYFIILFYLFRATDIIYEIAKCKLSSSVNFFRSTLRLDTFLSSELSPTVLCACASASVLCKNIFWKENGYLLNSVYRIITKNLQTNPTWSFDKSFDHAMFLLLLYICILLLSPVCPTYPHTETILFYLVAHN